MLDRKLLDILVCPICKADITLNREKTGLICTKCQLEYPIRDDIPVMLPDEARSLEEGSEEGG